MQNKRNIIPHKCVIPAEDNEKLKNGGTQNEKADILSPRGTDDLLALRLRGSSNSASDSKQEASTPMESAANDDIAYDEEADYGGLAAEEGGLSADGTGT